MTKFNRWLGSDPPPNLAEMLSVARAEQPDGRVLRRTLAALGLGTSVAATGLVGTAKAATVASVLAPRASAALFVGKWVFVGLASAGLGAGVVASVQSLTTAEHGPAQASRTLPLRQGAHVKGQRPGDRVVRADTPPPEPKGEAAPSRPADRRSTSQCATQDRPASPVEPSSGVASFNLVDEQPDVTVEPPAIGASLPGTPPGQVPSAVAGGKPKDVRFQRELALVDAARGSLAARDPGRALTFLRQHTREFGTLGHFAPEARYLQLEAYRLTGDRARAREAAKAILRRDPSGPHVDTALAEIERGEP